MPFILNLFYYKLSVAALIVVECLIIPVLVLVICMHLVRVETTSLCEKLDDSTMQSTFRNDILV
jgi:hypothetical protein